jgi:hypothetical protein
MQIAVNDVGGNLGDFPDMRAEGFPACLFGQSLRDRDQRYEDDSGDQARDAEDNRVQSSSFRRGFPLLSF